MSDGIDPDDAPELTGELAEVVETRAGGEVVGSAAAISARKASYAAPAAAWREQASGNATVRPRRDHGASRGWAGVSGADDRDSAHGSGIVMRSKCRTLGG